MRRVAFSPHYLAAYRFSTMSATTPPGGVPEMQVLLPAQSFLLGFAQQAPCLVRLGQA